MKTAKEVVRRILEDDFDPDDLGYAMDAYSRSPNALTDRFPGIGDGLVQRGFHPSEHRYTNDFSRVDFNKSLPGPLCLTVRIRLLPQDVENDEAWIDVRSNRYDDDGVMAFTNTFERAIRVPYTTLLDTVDRVVQGVQQFNNDDGELRGDRPLRGERLEDIHLFMMRV